MARNNKPFTGTLSRTLGERQLLVMLVHIQSKDKEEDNNPAKLKEKCENLRIKKPKEVKKLKEEKQKQ